MGATWGDFVNARMPAHMRDHIRATEAAEQRAFEAEQAERADRLDTARRMGEVQESAVIYRTGHSSAEWREAASNIAAAREARNYQGEYGSPERPAGMWTGADGSLHRFEPRETHPSRQPDPIEASLARARESQERSRPFMSRMVAELERRQQASGHTISRSAIPEQGEHVECVECAAEGLDAAMSFQVHYHPRFGDPLPPVTVPDYPPSRSRRVKSGVGWPELVR
jgi:hypothetical protein